MNSVKRVHVKASGEYDILIGERLLKDAGMYLAEVITPCCAAVITDDTVAQLYGSMVEDSLRAAGFEPLRYVFPHGEQSKSMDTLSRALEWLADMRVSRGDLIVALGGGVVGDLAGFAAAIYGRGMRYVHLPTTLLAAVDSSVGGKTAVNLVAGKNMAGAFKQPHLVLCDIAALNTLDDRQISCGAAEIVKYGVLDDAGLFERMENGALMASLIDTIGRCVLLKAGYVARDEYDENTRQFLNLGHTLGHAAEKLSGYTISHGEGVSIGMALIARAAAKKGFCSADCALRIERALRANGLPIHCPYPAEQMTDAAQNDKKRRGGEITLVAPRDIGRCELLTIPIGELIEWVKAGAEPCA